MASLFNWEEFTEMLTLPIVVSTTTVLDVYVRLGVFWKHYTAWELNSIAQTKHDDNI